MWEPIPGPLSCNFFFCWYVKYKQRISKKNWRHPKNVSRTFCAALEKLSIQTMSMEQTSSHDGYRWHWHRQASRIETQHSPSAQPLKSTQAFVRLTVNLAEHHPADGIFLPREAGTCIRAVKSLSHSCLCIYHVEYNIHARCCTAAVCMRAWSFVCVRARPLVLPPSPHGWWYVKYIRNTHVWHITCASKT